MSLAQGTSARTWRTSRGAPHIDVASFGHARVRHDLATWQRTQRFRTVASDTAAGLLGVLVGLWSREALLGGNAALWGSAEAMRATVCVLVGLWLLLLARHGAYAVRYMGSGPEEYRAVTRAAATLVAVVAVASFAFKLEFSRGVLLFAVPMTVAATIGARWMLRRQLASAWDAGRCLAPTVLVGDARAVLDLANRITASPRTTGMRVSGVCVSDLHDPVLATPEFADLLVLGDETTALAAVDRVGAGVVAVASSPTMAGTALRRLGWALEQRDVDLLIAPGIVEVAGPRLTMRPAAGVPMLHVERPVSSGLRYGSKLLADRVLALMLIVFAAPVLIAIAVMVRRDSSGPALFTQNRVGEGGRTFRMIKFRTMVVDAQDRLTELDSDDGNGVLFKLRTDPRVTRFGAVLRRFSLDELPQLFNVLRGEMSLVGPRPPLPSEVDTYESDAVRRLRVRPGMTGLWQVSGRSDLSWGDSVRLDLWYVDNWTLALDAQILFRTANAVFQGKGAY
jgi:exopolysaccharide biosynthesis polyprenyl glycosylphosphotransferase